MKKCISLGVIDKTQLLLQIIPITVIVFGNIIYYNDDNNEISFYNHVFAMMVSKSIGKCLSFIPFIIFCIRNKDSKNQNLIANNEAKYSNEYFKKFERIKISKFLLIFISSLFYFLNNIIDYLVTNAYPIDIIIFDIICLTFLSYLVMDIKIYIHQYFSIFVILIVGIIKNIINFNSPELKMDWIKILISFLLELIFTATILLQKFIMEYRFCTPYELCFYDGIFSLIFSIIGYIIVTNKEISPKKENDEGYFVRYNNKYYIDNFYEYFGKFVGDMREVYTFLYQIAYHSIYFLFPLIVIKKYTVFHYLIIVIFNDFYSFDFNTEKVEIALLNMSCLLIIIFMHLIFNELIEMNCFGFQNNTRRNITQRAIDDASKKNRNDTITLSISSLDSLGLDDYKVSIN